MNHFYLKRENNRVAIVLNIGDNQAFVLTFVSKITLLILSGIYQQGNYADTGFEV